MASMTEVSGYGSGSAAVAQKRATAWLLLAIAAGLLAIGVEAARGWSTPVSDDVANVY